MEKDVSTPIVTVQDFRKTYGEFTAIDGISFDIREGEIFGLLGPNGAGKTSTLECLEGLRRPDGGVMQIAGLDPATDSPKLRNLIGVQLQSASLPESITPREAMRLFCSYHNVDPRYDLLERLGISEKSQTQFYELSAGQQRRLVLALAVAHDPKVLFLDEPTAGLDVASRVELHSLMKELQARGTTILLATHYMAEAEDMSDRMAILLKGKLAAIGTPMQITATGAGLTRISVRTECDSLLNPVITFPSVQHFKFEEQYIIYFSQNVSATLADIMASINFHKDTIIDLRVERPSLEDRFLEITSRGGVR